MKTACLQITAGPDVAENAEHIAALMERAADAGAEFIATPENSCCLLMDGARKISTAVPEADHPLLRHAARIAKARGVFVLVGSVGVPATQGRLYNRSYLFGQDGEKIASYDKIHLFDVDLPTGERHRESERVAPGNRAVVAACGEWKAGLTICYDVRFPHLYRHLAKAGADIIFVPAAFTVPTGQAHWETLLCARAIENGCYIVAPAQTGTHDGGRQTYGHSLIIDPWGRVLADGGAGTDAIVMADLDKGAVAKARAAIPALTHDRDFN